MTKLVTLRTPKRYKDCEKGGINEARPCPYKDCKHWIKNEGQCTLDYAKWGRMSIKEIAEVLGTTEKAVERALDRALKKLAKNKVLREFYER